jgi:hypothetical protein
MYNAVCTHIYWWQITGVRTRHHLTKSFNNDLEAEKFQTEVFFYLSPFYCLSWQPLGYSEPTMHMTAILGIGFSMPKAATGTEYGEKRRVSRFLHSMTRMVWNHSRDVRQPSDIPTRRQWQGEGFRSDHNWPEFDEWRYACWVSTRSAPVFVLRGCCTYGLTLQATPAERPDLTYRQGLQSSPAHPPIASPVCASLMDYPNCVDKSKKGIPS